MRVRYLILVLCLLVVGVRKVNAAATKIALAFETMVDPETGRTGYQVLNPSGDVDVTYTPSGALLKFVDKDGKADAFKITAEFPNRPPRESNNIGENIYDKILADSIAVNGKRMPATILKNISSELAKHGKMLFLYFDRAGRMGFHVREFDMSAVKIISGPQTVSLAQAIFNTLSAGAKAETDRVLKEQQAAMAAEKFACAAVFTPVL